jgi:hypothetical protein
LLLVPGWPESEQLDETCFVTALVGVHTWEATEQV